MLEAASFAPEPEELITAKIELASITAEDLVFDLGCGDGRLLVRVVEQAGTRCVGVEARAELAREAAREVAERNLGDYIRIRCDAYEAASLSEADVVLLSARCASSDRLSKKLDAELRPGVRIVSHGLELPGWLAEQRVVIDLGDGGDETLFRYVR